MLNTPAPAINPEVLPGDIHPFEILAWRVPSATHQGIKYIVRMDAVTGRFSCNCPAMVKCRHIKQMENLVKMMDCGDDEPLPVTPTFAPLGSLDIDEDLPEWMKPEPPKPPSPAGGAARPSVFTDFSRETMTGGMALAA